MSDIFTAINNGTHNVGFVVLAWLIVGIIGLLLIAGVIKLAKYVWHRWIN